MKTRPVPLKGTGLVFWRLGERIAKPKTRYFFLIYFSGSAANLSRQSSEQK